MKARRSEIQVFSVSFLDVICCALGGTLLLLLLNMIQSQKETDSLREELKAFVGLEGEMQNVVFVFDTSGSMVGKGYDSEATPEGLELFQGHKDALNRWVEGLSFEKFNVIRFAELEAGDLIEACFPGRLVEATEANRKTATTFISRLEGDGGTPTLGALKMALSMKNVDTIILLSDGAPSDATAEEILDYLQTHVPKDLTINTVGMGDYFEAEYGRFLQAIARQNNGVFIGR